MDKHKEELIREIVRCSVIQFATAFSGKHLSQKNDENGIINMMI